MDANVASRRIKRSSTSGKFPLLMDGEELQESKRRLVEIGEGGWDKKGVKGVTKAECCANYT
jgi:hypothetical protein